MRSIGRRWFQFSLRALFGVMVVTCFFGAWLARERQLARDQVAAAENIRQAGGVAMCCPSYARDEERDSFRNRLKNALVAGSMEDINYVSLHGAHANDQNLTQLPSLPNLRSLTIAGKSVTDRGLTNLSGLKRLKRLNLSGARITDAGLRCVRDLSQLEGLSLKNTDITDAGLVHLRGLTQLRELELQGTKVTKAGAIQLQESLPALQISFEE